MKKKKKSMRAVVQKIIKPAVPNDSEKAELSIDEGEELYREVRVENTLSDEQGEKFGLKPGAKVDVVIEADTEATLKKPD